MARNKTNNIKSPKTTQHTTSKSAPPTTAPIPPTSAHHTTSKPIPPTTVPIPPTSTMQSVLSMAGSNALGYVAGSYISQKLFNNDNKNTQNVESTPIDVDFYVNLKKCLQNNPDDYNLCKNHIDEIIKKY
jgi:hypothetical protein